MVFDTLNEVRFVVENADGFLGEVATTLFHLSDFCALFHEIGTDAEVVGDSRWRGEAERVGKDAINERLGAGGVDLEVLLVKNAVKHGATRGARLDDALIVEFEIWSSFVMVDDEDRVVVETVCDYSVVEELGKKDGCGGVDNDVAVSLVVEVSRDAAPALEVAHVFWNFDRTIERNFATNKRGFERERRAQRIAVRVFRLDDTDALLVFNEFAEFVVHGYIITGYNCIASRRCIEWLILYNMNKGAYAMKTLIYKSTTRGSFPRVTIIHELYDTGELLISEAFFDDAPNIQNKQIASEDIRKILKLFDKNPRIFSIKDIELANEYLREDASSTEVFLSDGQRSNTLRVADSFILSEDNAGFPDTKLLADLEKSIDEILQKYGVES